MTRDDNSSANNLTLALFAIYLAALLWIVILKLGVHFSYMGTRKISLIPFNDLLTPNAHASLGEMILNVVIFVPLGIYVAPLFKQLAFPKKALLCFSTSLACELLQLNFVVGAFDLTDIINNTFGGVVGLLAFSFFERALKSTLRAQRLVNTIASIGTVFMVSLLFLLKMNLLPLRYK